MKRGKKSLALFLIRWFNMKQTLFPPFPVTASYFEMKRPYSALGKRILWELRLYFKYTPPGAPCFMLTYSFFLRMKFYAYSLFQENRYSKNVMTREHKLYFELVFDWLKPHPRISVLYFLLDISSLRYAKFKGLFQNITFFEHLIAKLRNVEENVFFFCLSTCV